MGRTVPWRRAVRSGRSFLGSVFERRRGPIVFVAVTVVFAWAVTALLLIPVALLSSPTRAQAPDLATAGAFGLLVLGPVFENLVAVAIIESMAAYRARIRVIVLTVAAVSGAAHALYGWRAIAGFVCFGTWTFSYLVWYDLRFWRRFALTVAQHALFNAPATLWIVWSVSAS